MKNINDILVKEKKYKNGNAMLYRSDKDDTITIEYKGKIVYSSGWN